MSRSLHLNRVSLCLHCGSETAYMIGPADGYDNRRPETGATMAVPCPKCGSNQTTKNTRGTTSFGTPRIILTCLECGFQWSPIQDRQSGSGCGPPTQVGCGTVFLVVLVIGAISVIFNRNPPAGPQPNQPGKEVRQAKPIPVATKEVAVPDGYREIAQTFANAAHNLGSAAKYKDEVATKWMRLKGVGTDNEFGSFLAGLMDRVHQPAADTIEDADRLVAQGQLQLALALTTKGNSQAGANLWDISEKLTHLVGEPPHIVPVPEASPRVAGPMRQLTVPAERAKLGESRRPSEPPAEKSPEEVARDKYGFVLKQAKELIKSNLNSAARPRLQRVIDGVARNRNRQGGERTSGHDSVAIRDIE